VEVVRAADDGAAHFGEEGVEVGGEATGDGFVAGGNGEGNAVGRDGAALIPVVAGRMR